MADQKMTWADAVKKQGNKRTTGGSSQQTISRGYEATGSQSRPSSSFDGLAPSAFDNWEVSSQPVINGGTLSPAPNQDVANNSALHQQTSIGHPPEMNNKRCASSTVPSPGAYAAPGMEIGPSSTLDSTCNNEEARLRRDGLSFIRNIWNRSETPNQGLENNTCSSFQQQTPIGHPPKQKNPCPVVSAKVGQGKKVGGAFFNAKPRGRHYPASTRHGLYSQAGSGPSSMNLASLGPINTPQDNSVRTFEFMQSARNRRFPMSNTNNFPSCHDNFHQPPQLCNVNFNITLQNQCCHRPAQHRLSHSFTVCFPNIPQQLLFSQPSQPWAHQYTAVPDVSQNHWNPNCIQYYEAEQDHYQDPWLTPSNQYDYTVNPSENQYQHYPIAPLDCGVLTSESSFGASSNARGGTDNEPLNYSSTWGSPQVSDNSWMAGNLTSENAGAIDQPLDSSSYPENNHEGTDYSCFPNNSSPLAPDVTINLPDPAPPKGDSN